MSKRRFISEIYQQKPDAAPRMVEVNADRIESAVSRTHHFFKDFDLEDNIVNALVCLRSNGSVAQVFGSAHRKFMQQQAEEAIKNRGKLLAFYLKVKARRDQLFSENQRLKAENARLKSENEALSEKAWRYDEASK